MATISRTQKSKIKAISILLVFTILIPIGKEYSMSNIPTDMYWRYQGEVISQYILQTGRIPLEGFQSRSYLIKWAGTFVDDFSAPILVSIISIWTGLDSLTVAYLPILVIPLILIQGEISKIIIGHDLAYPVSIILAVGFKFVNFHLVSTIHRVLLGMLMFFLLVWFLLRYNSNSKPVLFGMAMTMIMFTMAYRTLALSFLVFFTVLHVASQKYSSKLFNRELFLMFIVINIIYYSVLFTWLGNVLLKFVAASSFLGLTGQLTFSEIFHSSIGLHPSLSTYLLQPEAPIWYDSLIWSSRLIAIGLFGSIILIRIWEIRKGKSTRKSFDIILIAVLSQAFLDLLLLPFFPPNGGTSIRLLITYLLPIFSPLVFIKLHQMLSEIGYSKIASVSIVIVLTILLSLPAYSVMIAHPQMSNSQVYHSSNADTSMMKWSNKYLRGEIVSDFNSLSMYYAYGGRQDSYIPPPGASGYSNSDTAQRLISTYYTNPLWTRELSKYYMITDNMLTIGMAHINGILTKPNHQLDNSISKNKNGLKIYTSGQGDIYKYR